jgi:hypothetical protein
LTLPLKLRPAVPGDVGFIVTSWLKSATDAWNKIRTQSVDDWHGTGVQIGQFADATGRLNRGAIASILQREHTRVSVACADDDDDVIFGFAVGEPVKRIVHWVYVKHGADALTLRHRGIAHQLIEHLMPGCVGSVTTTYLPREFVGMASKWGIKFDPHAGR